MEPKAKVWGGQLHRSFELWRPFSFTLLWVTIAASSLGLLVPAGAAAFAQLEQVGTFAAAGEETQLGGVVGIAVNAEGSGGVPAGTIYAVTQNLFGEVHIARYGPDEKFIERWKVTVLEEPYEVCGPGSPGKTPCPVLANASPRAVDVDLDQKTGNVYVYDGTAAVGSKAIVEYVPDGSKVLARFGEFISTGNTTAATPASIHTSPYPGNIAVNESGEVYVFDLNSPDNFYHRLMVFEPQVPGDYEHYVYGGTSKDVGAGFFGETEYPAQPVLDAKGDIYVGGIGGEAIEKYDLTEGRAKPSCTFKYKPAGVTSFQPNQETGEVFFYSYKAPKRIRQLAPCNEGKFTEAGVPIQVSPPRDDLYAMAFDPKRQFSLTRPPGVLYAGAPSAEPSSGVGKGEPGKTSLGYVFAPQEIKEHPPVIESESASAVTATSVRLEAAIDPQNIETRYAFEYLTATAYEDAGNSFEGAARAPIGGATLAKGEGAVTVASTATGLAPDTDYRWRVVASSHCDLNEPEKVCEVASAPLSFRTYPLGAGGPADGRIWELVSPAQKNGGQVFPSDPTVSSCIAPECKPGAPYNHFPMQSAPDGNSVVYEGSPFSPSGTAVIENEYLAKHTDAGWVNSNLTPPALNSKGGQGYRAFDANLTTGIVGQIRPALSPEAPSDYSNLYTQPTAAPTTLGAFLTNLNATISCPSGNASGSLNLAYVGGSANLSRVFFAANDALTPEASGICGETNLYEWSAGQLHLVNLAPGGTESLPGATFGSQLFRGPAAISTDASHAFWTSKAGQLYVRLNASETVEVDDPGEFLTAAADGSRALLADGCLYDLETESCEDVTAGLGGFQGVVGQSKDLSHLYFVDTAVLTGEEVNSEGAKAQGGKPNLYSWNEGTTKFIATMSGKEDATDWRASPSSRTAEASPSGRWVAFLSQAPLTGFDNVGPCEVSGGGEIITIPCREAFLYDSVTGDLICASCNSAGVTPLGRTVLRQIAGASPSMAQPSYLTDSGRLYFDSQDSLVPTDTNGNVEDVYQYEPEGVGDCTLEGGCVSLISAGRGSSDSNFLAMDSAGNNVFFTTRDPLVSADKDELVDLYDARVGGGIDEAAAPAPCQGETCQPTVPPVSEPLPQNSGTAGNVKPAGKKCGKGQVKKNGRCVKKHKQKKKKPGKRAKAERGGAK
jgi:hypothetical protein